MGHVVLQDRGAWSAYAYSGLEDPLVHSVGHQGVPPDLTVLVDADPGTCLQRVSERHRRPFDPSVVPQVGSAPERPSDWRTEADWFDASAIGVYEDRYERYHEVYRWWEQEYGRSSVLRVANSHLEDMAVASDTIIRRVTSLL